MIKRHKPSTEMKTKMCIVALLTVSALSPTLGQEKIPAGVVHGPKAGFNISAPEGLGCR
jgi:hypothetical protein